MATTQGSTLDQVKRAVRRIPFGIEETFWFPSFLVSYREQGAAINYHPDMDDSLSSAGDGVVLFRATDLGIDFALLKVAGSMSWFGRQRALYAVYFGPLGQDAFVPGPTFPKLKDALSGVGRTYTKGG